MACTKGCPVNAIEGGKKRYTTSCRMFASNVGFVLPNVNSKPSSYRRFLFQLITAGQMNMTQQILNGT
jgi:hypothetical protein